MSELDRIIEVAKTEALAAIKEHYDYFQEVVGWMRGYAHDNAHQKHLPYHDFESLKRTQELGAKLFHESTIAGIIHENLLSYIVGTGHSYKVVAVNQEDGEDEVSIRAQKAIDQFITRREWPDDQEEFYNRWFRSGDTIRIVDLTGDTIEFAYVEPHNLGPPSKPNDAIAKAPFGIRYEGGNVNKPDLYWIGFEPDKDRIPVPKWGSKRVVLHGKRGIDRNDPRGVPLLWKCYCDARECDELERILSKIMAATGEHAVVYDYSPEVSNAAIYQVAEGATLYQVSANNSGMMAPNAGGAHHSKGYKVVLNGANVNGMDWSNVLQVKRRNIGNVAGLPEFIMTGDADTGSRNSLLSAEAPFTRRISREARRGSAHEIEVLYHAIAASAGKFGDPKWMEQFRADYRIQVETPLAESQDKSAESQRILAEMAAEVTSPQMACSALGRSYDDVQRDLDLHAERQEQRRQQFGAFRSLDVDEIQVRAQVAQTLISNGTEPESALTYVGLDPVEHITLVAVPTPAPTQDRGGGDPADAAA